jgi:hypothetical protein
MSLKGKALLEAVVALAISKGVAVRKEPLKTANSQGGLCLFKGVPTVFVDERAIVDAQIEMLAAVLRRFEWSDQERASMNPTLCSLVSPRGRAERPSTP